MSLALNASDECNQLLDRLAWAVLLDIEPQCHKLGDKHRDLELVEYGVSVRVNKLKAAAVFIRAAERYVQVRMSKQRVELTSGFVLD